MKDYTLHAEWAQIPVLRTRGTVLRDEIAAEAAHRIGSYRAEEVEMVMKVVEEVTADFLTGGYIVKNDIGTLQPGITGIWNSDRIQPSARARNKAVVNFTMSKELKKRFSNPLFHAVEAQRRGPLLESCVDRTTGSYNKVITPGGIIELAGSRLRFIPENEQHGVFFEDADTGKRLVFIRARLLPVATTGRCVFQAPLLPPGRYRLGLVNQCTNSGRPVKNLRTAYLPEVLEVKGEA